MVQWSTASDFSHRLGAHGRPRGGGCEGEKSGGLRTSCEDVGLVWLVDLLTVCCWHYWLVVRRRRRDPIQTRNLLGFST